MLDKLAELLIKEKAYLVTAESCTGGLLAKMITDLPGSSSWFDRGFVTYSNDAKQDMLQVPAELIEQQGAVSEAVVGKMTEGALANSKAEYAIAISGIAGPGGGTPDKPVGTVCFSVHKKDAEPRLNTKNFSGDRDAVRKAAAEYAIEQLLITVSNNF